MTLDYLASAIRDYNKFNSGPDKMGVEQYSGKHLCEIDGCSNTANCYIWSGYRTKTYFCSTHYIEATVPALRDEPKTEHDEHEQAN